MVPFLFKKMRYRLRFHTFPLVSSHFTYHQNGKIYTGEKWLKKGPIEIQMVTATQVIEHPPTHIHCRYRRDFDEEVTGEEFTKRVDN